MLAAVEKFSKEQQEEEIKQEPIKVNQDTKEEDKGEPDDEEREILNEVQV